MRQLAERLLVWEIPSRMALRISLVVAAVLASCTPDECRQVESSEAAVVTLDHDALCALENTHALDEPFRSASSIGQANLAAPDCARICGDVPVFNCSITDNGRFSQFHPEVVPPPPPPPCYPHLGDVCPDLKHDAGVASPGRCPFADAVWTQTLTCNRHRTREECHPAGYSHGRRPDGYARAPVTAETPELGAYFAICAHLEAASVVAFDALAIELTAHGFPAAVIASCSRAAREEVEHSAAIDRLSSRFGGERLPLFAPEGGAPRALVDIAIENAVEGCVGEVFGAAEALFRARVAKDEEVRRVLARIADEEAGHAELSVRIGELLSLRLDEDERERVREATEGARRRLREEIAHRALSPAVMNVAGVPGRAEALALFDALEDSIWAVAS